MAKTIGTMYRYTMINEFEWNNKLDERMKSNSPEGLRINELRDYKLQAKANIKQI